MYLHHLKYCETNQNKLKLDECRPRVVHFTSVPDLLLKNRRAQLEAVSRNSDNYLDILMKEILLIFCFSIKIHYRSLLSKARRSKWPPVVFLRIVLNQNLQNFRLSLVFNCNLHVTTRAEQYHRNLYPFLG